MKNKRILMSILLPSFACACSAFDLPSPKDSAALSIMVKIAECKFDEAGIAIDSLVSADSGDPLGWMLRMAEISLQQLDYDKSSGADSFQITYDRAKAVMKTYERRTGADSYLLTIKGLTQIIATASIMHRKKYWSAIRTGFDALDLCKEAKKIDSGNIDADFILGLYNYARAELKRKFLGILFWYSGDKQSGIRVIENCSRSARLIPLVADMVLQEIYVKEGMYDKASAGIERLLASSPGNRFVLWTKSKLCEARKMPDQAAVVYGTLADAYEQVPAAQKNYFSTRYLEAKRYFEAKNAVKALNACDRLLVKCKECTDDYCDEAEALSTKLHREMKP
jgi:tetratricopeptide (TPR) repeat protein